MISGSMAKLYLLILITPACFSMQPQRNYPHVHVPNLFDLLLLSAAAEKLSEVKAENLTETSSESYSEIGALKHRCPHCDYSTIRRWALKNHVAQHTHNYRYNCNQCSYGSSSLYNFERHLKAKNHTARIAQ